MKINNHETFVLLESEQSEIKDLISEIENKTTSEFQENNIVVDLLSNKSVTINDLLLFLNLSNNHKETNHSFVIINDTIDPDEFPEELVVVPTLQEAEDMIEMEAIERELGF
ncbi:MAG: ribonuclease Z [Flavobacteriaceae bacterium]